MDKIQILRRIKDMDQQLKMIDPLQSIWSSGMILASGGRGLKFDSKNAPNNYIKFEACNIIRFEIGFF